MKIGSGKTTSTSTVGKYMDRRAGTTGKNEREENGQGRVGRGERGAGRQDSTQFGDEVVVRRRRQADGKNRELSISLSLWAIGRHHWSSKQEREGCVGEGGGLSQKKKGGEAVRQTAAA